jgi:hypothetical protein
MFASEKWHSEAQKHLAAWNVWVTLPVHPVSRSVVNVAWLIAMTLCVAWCRKSLPYWGQKNMPTKYNQIMAKKSNRKLIKRNLWNNQKIFPKWNEIEIICWRQWNSKIAKSISDNYEYQYSVVKYRKAMKRFIRAAIKKSRRRGRPLYEFCFVVIRQVALAVSRGNWPVHQTPPSPHDIRNLVLQNDERLLCAVAKHSANQRLCVRSIRRRLVRMRAAVGGGFAMLTVMPSAVASVVPLVEIDRNLT